MRNVLLIVLAGLLLVGPASGSGQSTITFSFKGYANNVRVRPPLVGAFQLGVSRISGSGSLAPGKLTGTFFDRVGAEALER